MKMRFPHVDAVARDLFNGDMILMTAAIHFVNAGIRASQEVSPDRVQRAHAITAAFAQRVHLEQHDLAQPLMLAEANRAWREIGDAFFGPLMGE